MNNRHNQHNRALCRRMEIILLLISVAVPLFAQQYPTDYFRHPLNLPVSMSGDFGEIRPNHFHSGIDLRTDGKTGEAVYAPADGYVSRVNISPWGGGKVLYITHPNGYRTAYMHLDEFCGAIGKFVHDYQYEHQVYAFDIDLPVDSFKVKKGELVARSGNTGGSMGPHLHYDIRYASNDQPINPLYFGIKYSDPIAPTIVNIKLYPSDRRTTLEGTNRELWLTERVTKGKKAVNVRRDTVVVAGSFYAGIYTYDQMEAGSSKNGVESIDLYIDGKIFWHYSVPTFLFEETRAINAIIDYPQYRKNREYYIVTRFLRGNRNNWSYATNGNGHIRFDDDELHRLEYQVSDLKGNITKRAFFVRSKPSALLPDTDMTHIEMAGDPITYFKRFAKSYDGFRVEIEPYTVYESDYLTHHSSNDGGRLSQRHTIGLKLYPLPPHHPIRITMPVPPTAPAHLQSKLLIVCINGKDCSACVTQREGNNLTATCRSFGGFAVRLDTVPPTIKPTGFADGKTITASTFSVKIGDNLSGVDKYACYINGAWQLAEYDGKSASLIVKSELLKKGSNEVVFRVSDQVGNESEQQYTLRR